MESGGSSNQQQRDTTRAAATSGTVTPAAGSPASAAANTPATNAGDQNPPQSFRREADHYMPMANVVRIMRSVLPPHAKIADDAKEAIQECASEFIGFITTEANERCHREYRKTISPEDVIAAMGSLGFDNYVEPLTAFINRYRAEDPERVQLPVVRRGGAAQQPPEAPPVIGEGDEAVDPSEYIGFPEVIREYFMGNQGGGDDEEASSSGGGGN